MQQPFDEKRIGDIFQMFDEFSKRNFSHRIEAIGRHSYLDALAVYLNLFANELENYLHYHEQPEPGESTVKAIEDQPPQLLANYIMLHLEEPLPTLKVLSRMFFTNDRKLKEGFRAMYNTSIYQFYNQERLKKAQLLILDSKKPLKEIAALCGFNTYHNFSSAFKKHFGMAPVTLRAK